MTSPEVHIYTETAVGDQVAFTFWPRASADSADPAVAVEVSASDGRPAVGATVPWEDFQRMVESMYQAWREAQGKEME